MSRARPCASSGPKPAPSPQRCAVRSRTRWSSGSVTAALTTPARCPYFDREVEACKHVWAVVATVASRLGLESWPARKDDWYASLELAAGDFDPRGPGRECVRLRRGFVLAAREALHSPAGTASAAALVEEPALPRGAGGPSSRASDCSPVTISALPRRGPPLRHASSSTCCAARRPRAGAASG